MRPPLTGNAAFPAVLVAESDEELRATVAMHLEAAGFGVEVARDGSDALAKLRARPFDVAVVAVEMPGPSGFEVLETCRSEHMRTRVVIATSAPSVESCVRALRGGAGDYLVKPLAMAELVARVRVAARRGAREATRARGDALHFEELLIDPRNVQA